MAKSIAVFIAMSLDGYIATKQDSLEWLMKTAGEGDNGYGEFYATVDTVVMGRRTYDWLLTELGIDHFPYADKACYVFSSTLQGSRGNVHFVNEDATTFVRRFDGQQGGKLWLVGGGRLLHDFMKEQLIDEWIITVTPTVLGQGIPLFLPHETETRLTLVGVRTFNQFVALHYNTHRPATDG